jgi:hypothetical protein
VAGAKGVLCLSGAEDDLLAALERVAEVREARDVGEDDGAVVALEAVLLRVAVCADEGARSFGTTVCHSFRDSPYKREWEVGITEHPRLSRPSSSCERSCTQASMQLRDGAISLYDHFFRATVKAKLPIWFSSPSSVSSVSWMCCRYSRPSPRLACVDIRGRTVIIH